MFAILAAATLCFSKSAVAADNWTVVQAVGDVTVISAPGVTPIAVKPSAPLPDGATITTGPSGRAVLLRGRETIVMSPSSQVTLPNGPNKSISQVKQTGGTLLFKVGKKPEAHFEVNTPYLAAVVKGTTFTVKVTSQGASVHVLEGAVEVSTLDQAQSFLTRAGQISSVFAKSASNIFTTGASLLNNSGGVEGGWANGTSEFELEGGPGFWDTPTRTYNDTGLRARKATLDKEAALTERAPAKLLAAAQATEETMSGARKMQETAKPKDGSVKVSGDKDSDKKKPSDKATNERDGALGKDKADAAKKPNATQAADSNGKKAKDDSANKPAERGTVRDRSEIANVWTVTQVKGTVKVDGAAYAVTAGGLTRTLQPGSKIETGPDGRIGVAFSTREFVIDANSVVVLDDAVSQREPLVVTGVALHYVEASGKYEAVTPLSASEVEALRASGKLDGAGGKMAMNDGATVGGSQEAGGIDGALGPQVNRMRQPQNKKTEEVRTKVISGLTLGLYGLTGALMMFFGARWIWSKYRAKPKGELEVETPAQARLRNIKGG
jgi:hypothetical protein